MRGAPNTYFDFSGGVSLEAAPYLLEANQARDALNVHTNAYGQLRKRTGFPTLVSLAAAPASFTDAPHSLFAANLSTKYLLAVGKIGSSDDRVVSITQGGTVTDRTPGSLPYTVNSRWYFAQAQATSGGKGPIFAMNGVDTPQHWTGSGNFADWTADVGTVPTGAKYLTYHENRLWCAAGSRLYYSGITGTSPDTGNWDADNFVDLEPSDGQAITAIATFGTYLLVFKARKVWVIEDSVTAANRELADGIGCIAHRSCVETPQGLFFLDEEQGVMVTDGNKIDNISQPITPVFRAAAAYPTTLRNAAAIYNDNRYQLSLSLAGQLNDHTYEYDLDRQSWWIHSCASNQFALVDPQAAPVLYSANPATTNVQKAFVAGEFEDSGAPYSGGSFWTSAEFVWGAPHVQKRVREVRVDGVGDWTLDYAHDWIDDFFTDSGETWSVSEVDTTIFAPTLPDGELFAPTSPSGDDFAPLSEAVTDRRYYTLGFGRSWSFRFSNDDSGDFQIYSMTVATTGRTD